MITSIRQNGKIIKTTIETASQKISFINLGASIIQWMTQDGKEIVPAYLDYNDYQMQEKPGMYLGATIGPVAGRIKNSSFDLNNRHYSITADYPSFLHSGKESFAFKYFEISETGKDSLGEFIIYKLNYKHPVFPADLVVFVRYTVNPGLLEIDYDVNAREDSLVNMTSHVYFNLDGDPSQDLSKTHELEIPSSKVVAVGNDLVGTEIMDITGTGFDFRKPRLMTDAFNDSYLMKESPLGIDNYYILPEERKYDAKVRSLKTNKALTIKSDYPGINLYTGNFPNELLLLNNKPMAFHGALALEPHFQTNAVNDQRFAGYSLAKGQQYHHRISYRLEEQG